MLKKTTDDDLRWLREQIKAWEETPSVSREQIDQLKLRFDSVDSEKNARSSVITTIAIMGALLIGGGILLFVASNWSQIPREAKLAIIFGAIFGFNWLGYRLAVESEKYGKIGIALLEVGAISFGAGIWLVSQAYNIGTITNYGVLYWAIGIYPVATLLTLEVVSVTSTVLLLVWTTLDFADFHIASTAYPILAAMLFFPLAYRKDMVATLITTLVGMELWLCYYLLETRFDNAHDLVVFPLISAGMIINFIGEAHEFLPKYKHFGGLYRLFGLTTAVIAFFLVSSYDFSKFIVSTMNDPALVMPMRYIVIILIGLQGYFFMYLSGKREIKDALEKLEGTFFGALIAFPMTMYFIHSAFVFALLANIVLLTVAVLMVVHGYYRNSATIVNAGFIVFGAQFASRYFDFAMAYLSRSAFFISAGVFLLLGAFLLERSRRKIIGKMETNSEI